MVSEMLRERMQQEEGYERAMAEDLAAAPVRLKASGRYPSRSELHD